MDANRSTLQVPTCASSASLPLLLPVSSLCVWSVPDKDEASSESLCPSEEVLSSCTGSETRMLQVIMRLARVTAVQLCHNSLEQRLQILQARLRAGGRYAVNSS